MDGVGLRPATDGDIELVYRITEDAMRGYVEATWGRWESDEQREYCRRSFSTGTHRIVQVDGEDVGVLAVAEHPTHVQLEKLYLLAASRRRGVGSELLPRVLGVGQSAGLPVRLRVLAVNIAAQRFYARHGFTVSEHTAERVFMERAYE
ncbi:MAG: GNAT family N-acetyltransferase [Chloroflexota bacterium]